MCIRDRYRRQRGESSQRSFEPATRDHPSNQPSRVRTYREQLLTLVAMIDCHVASESNKAPDKTGGFRVIRLTSVPTLRATILDLQSSHLDGDVVVVRQRLKVNPREHPATRYWPRVLKKTGKGRAGS